MSAARPPSKPFRTRLATHAVAFAAAVTVALGSVPARAQSGRTDGIPIIRDAGIEHLLRDYAKPIFSAAGLGDRNIHVVIIDDRAFNAFVTDAYRVFVNASALLDSKTPNQVAYTQLAIAYGRKNDYANADLASAQAAFAHGDNKTARELAERAKQRFPIGSPGWVRTDDIGSFKDA